jgi:outer membrane receptor protein involved in Fe transport
MTRLRIAMVSEHASPLAALGGVDTGGQNTHVAELATALAERGHEVRVYTRRDDPDLAGTNTQPGNDRLRSMNYLDLSATFRIGDNYSFRMGVNNLLDSDPPVNGSQVCPAGPCNGNTWAQVYDALGRYIFAGVTLNF